MFVLTYGVLVLLVLWTLTNFFPPWSTLPLAPLASSGVVRFPAVLEPFLPPPRRPPRHRLFHSQIEPAFPAGTAPRSSYTNELQRIPSPKYPTTRTRALRGSWHHCRGPFPPPCSPWSGPQGTTTSAITPRSGPTRLGPIHSLTILYNWTRALSWLNYRRLAHSQPITRRSLPANLAHHHSELTQGKLPSAPQLHQQPTYLRGNYSPVPRYHQPLWKLPPVPQNQLSRLSSPSIYQSHYPGIGGNSRRGPRYTQQPCPISRFPIWYPGDSAAHQDKIFEPTHPADISGQPVMEHNSPTPGIARRGC